MEELIRRGALLDLIPTNKKTVGDVKAGSALRAVTVRWWNSGS